MKKLIFIALAMMAAAGAQAQQRTGNTPARATATPTRTVAAPVRTGAVSGQIVDGDTNRAMAGAYVELRSTADTTIVRSANSLPDGKFTVGNMPFGDYTVRVSFMGYEEYHSRVTLNMRNLTVAAFYMNQTSMMLDGAVVTAPMIRVSMHGDTIVYNPKAFKTAEDADAEAVIKQLPGAEVQDGTVKIQGKTVSKILVDNKETYGTDVAETMKTIPANMLEKIEVYDKLSDFAETTGINDGDDYTVMNFVTGIKFAVFGEASAMYGHKDLYAAGARFNMVTGSHRFGVNGGANNTGAAQAFDDMRTPGMFGGGGYGAQTGSGRGSTAANKTRNVTSGATYNFEPNEDFRFNANYRYGYAKSGSLNESETWYLNNPLFERQNSWSAGDNRSNRHNFGASSRWKIDKNNNINMRLQGSVSDSENSSAYQQQYFEDALATLVQDFVGDSRSNGDAYDVRLQTNYGLKMGNKGRSFRIGVYGNASKSDGDSFTNSHFVRMASGTLAALDSLGMSSSLSNSKNRGISTHAQYFEPLNRYTHLSLNYSFDYDYSNGERRANRWDYHTDLWSEWGAGSNVMVSKNHSHEYGLGLNYKKNNDQLRVDVEHDIETLTGVRTLPLPAWRDHKTYQNLEFSAEWRKQITPQRSVSIDLSTDNNVPSLSDIQSFDEISTSGLSVTGGNPGLRPSTSYQGMVRFTDYTLRNSTSFAAWLNGSTTTRPTGTDKYVVSEAGGWTSPNGTWLAPGTEYYRSVNMDRQRWNMSAGLSYGRPLKFLQSNFNANLSAGYDESPGLVNGVTNTARSQNYGAGLTLYSNFSQDVNISLDYDYTLGHTDNTNTLYANHSSQMHNLGFDLYWLFWKSFTMRANVNFSAVNVHQSGTGGDYYYDRTMANFALGKKLFKNKRGELTLAVNDLLNQRRTNTRNNYVDRIVFSKSYQLGRYYSLTFVYRLRNFSREDGARGSVGRGGARGGSRTRPSMGGGSHSGMRR